MSGSLITNKERLLSDVISGILPKTDAADFLVGYFYFSGYIALADGLMDKHVRILVGLDVETEIAGRVREVVELVDWEKNRSKVREAYFMQLVRLINESDNSDSEERIRIFRRFQRKIHDGTLEIRKTKDPCHAKMYLFAYNDLNREGGEQPGDMITGSSNLSYQGLQGRAEINVRFTEKGKYEEGKAIFDELWETAVPIVGKDSIDRWKEMVEMRIWIGRLFPPYEMYLRVLQEYFQIPSLAGFLSPSELTKGRYIDLKYQTDAVQLALRSLDIHNGVIIADVVGLGKSIIASTIARNMQLRTIVVSPPHLKSGWELYRDEFSFTGSVFSCGKIEDALKHYRELKHDDEQFLIIIDEAHRYRNEYTEDYAMLHNLCSGNKVVLLTATPFNNDPADIYSMLKLFQTPTRSTLKTVADLGQAFRELISRYSELKEKQRKGKLPKEEEKKCAGEIAGQIRTIIGPLVIRRSRLDLLQIDAYRKDLERQKIEPTIPDDPIELEYELGSLNDLYTDTLNLIYGTNTDEEGNPRDDGVYRFMAARYKPITYVPDDKLADLAKDIERQTGIDDVNMLIGRQSNVAKFMRRLLVRRFESSVAAFRSTLGFMIESSENIVEWMNRVGNIPVWKKGVLPDVDTFYRSTDDGMEEVKEAFERYAGKGFFTIDAKYIGEKFLAEVEADIRLLKGIQKAWFGEKNEIGADPKLESFIRLVKGMIEKEPQRKLVVFSEFADTVDYLGKALKDAGLPVMKFTSDDASPANRETIRANFDAGMKAELQRDDFKILVATDAISEGYNLHRAGAIFNYDIPYNPTRVIQRIGRINRINKKVFDHLFIYNYFPTQVGEKETRTKEISTLKMAMIHAIMGEDTKALTSDEECTAYFKERYRQEIEAAEELSWDTPYRKLLEEEKDSDAYIAAQNIPHRARIGRNADKPLKGALLFGKKGEDYVFKISDGGNEPVMLSAEEALSLFEAKQEEQAVELSEAFDQLYARVKASLFKNNETVPNDRRILTAIQKVKALRKYLPEEYLDDLLTALNHESLSGYEVRLIRGIKAKDAGELMEKIPQDYLTRIISAADSADSADETLIMAEELQ